MGQQQPVPPGGAACSSSSSSAAADELPTPAALRQLPASTTHPASSSPKPGNDSVAALTASAHFDRRSSPVPGAGAAGSSQRPPAHPGKDGGGQGDDAVRTPRLTWLPQPLRIDLPPNGRPTRLVLSGTPLLPGKYNVVGVRVTSNNVSWVTPFARRVKRVVGGGGGGGKVAVAPEAVSSLSRSSSSALAGGGAGPGGARADFVLGVVALPSLPVLSARLEGSSLGPEPLCLCCPSTAEAHASQPGSVGLPELVSKTAPVRAFAGQVCV